MINTGKLLLTTAFVFAAGSACAAPIVIDPNNVTASTELGLNFNRTVDQIVQPGDLVAGEHTSGNPNGTMWLSNGSGSFGGVDPDPFVLFDLGDVYTINSFQVWNYNEANLSNRGVKGVSVQYGQTAGLGSSVPGISSFAKASGLDTYTGEVFNAFAPFNARYIKFDISEGINVGNYGDGDTFYGLSEVQFDGVLVPEPSSLALLTLGGLLIARRRRA